MTRDEAVAEVLRLRAELAATQRELERWKHGDQVEGDYICPSMLTEDRLLVAVQMVAGKLCPSCSPRVLAVHKAHRELLGRKS